MALSGGAFGQPPNTPELFVSRSYVCSHHPSVDASQNAGCENLERDRAELLRRYEGQPKILGMIMHPEKVRSVGFVGVDQ
jgi:hypothetical protein